MLRIHGPVTLPAIPKPGFTVKTILPCNPALGLPTAMPLSWPTGLGRVYFQGGKSPSANPLIPANPSKIVMRQGTVPNCQLLTVIDAMLTHPAGKSLLEKMVIRQPDGAYQVTFPRFPHHPITVNVSAQNNRAPLEDRIRQFSKRIGLSLTDAELQQYRSLLKPSSDGRWGMSPEEHAQLTGSLQKMPPSLMFQSFVGGNKLHKILEVAYAQLQKTLLPEAYAHISDEDIVALYFDTKNYPYNGKIVFRDLTNWDSALIFFNGPDDKGTIMAHPEGFETQLKQFADAPEKFMLNVWTLRPAPGGRYVDPDRKYVGWHTFGVRKIDPEKRELHLRNPHDSTVPMVVPYADFFKYFRGVTVSYINTPMANPSMQDRVEERMHGK